MDKLPIELINLIYEFDYTKRKNFNKVINEFKDVVKEIRNNNVVDDDDLYYFDEMAIEMDFSFIDFFKTYLIDVWIEKNQ